MSADRTGGSSPGLLVRRPVLAEPGPRWAPVIDFVDQLEELADLHTRGLLSRPEFERQKRKILAS